MRGTVVLVATLVSAGASAQQYPCEAEQRALEVLLPENGVRELRAVSEALARATFDLMRCRKGGTGGGASARAAWIRRDRRNRNPEAQRLRTDEAARLYAEHAMVHAREAAARAKQTAASDALYEQIKDSKAQMSVVFGAGFCALATMRRQVEIELTEEKRHARRTGAPHLVSLQRLTDRLLHFDKLAARDRRTMKDYPGVTPAPCDDPKVVTLLKCKSSTPPSECKQSVPKHMSDLVTTDDEDEDDE